ncbi:protein of unknown function [Xenorhabdus poinarii G6]|uniref:Uncharacterized protein n=1 Tax=Xenorhabdus poinarii G6 TaxID=1354304 RepID=A0A068R2L4_9GAMM|nr:protein of unknown function [Xenorhabdus poinarii G6]
MFYSCIIGNPASLTKPIDKSSPLLVMTINGNELIECISRKLVGEFVAANT